MYEEIVDGLSKRVPDKKASGFTFVQADGKRKYTALKNEGNETTYTTEILVNQLDGEIFDPENFNCSPGESDITTVDAEDLTDYVFDNFYRPSESYMTFSNGRVKLDFFKTREFQIDKYIKIDESKGIPNVSGIVLDLEERPEFTEACEEGIICDMPTCFEYYNAIAGKDDDEIFEKAEEYKEDSFRREIEDLMGKTIDKVSAGAEVIPKGLYFIKDSKIYYLTAEEYYHIYYNSGYSKDTLFNLIEIPGFYQLNSGLIKNTDQAIFTINIVDKALGSLGEKNCFDLATVTDYGITPQDFLSRLLSNDSQVFELLGKTLKNQADMSRKMN